VPGSFAISLTVNGRRVEGETRPRTLLSDFLKDEVGLTGVRVSCEHAPSAIAAPSVAASPMATPPRSFPSSPWPATPSCA